MVINKANIVLKIVPRNNSRSPQISVNFIKNMQGMIYKTEKVASLISSVDRLHKHTRRSSCCTPKFVAELEEV